MAYDFDSGSSQAYNAGSLSASPPTSYTMAAWMNTDTTAAGNRVIVMMGESGGYSAILRLQASNLYTYLWDGTSDIGIFQALAVSAGTWYHVAVTWDGTTIRLWKNGADVANVGETTAGRAIDENGIGYQRHATAEYFDGKIAEVMYSTSAWSTTQIQGLASGASPLVVNPTGISLYYPMVRELHDPVGGTTLSAVGTPTVAVHPSVTTDRNGAIQT
jgi:hypothetical protein